MRPAKGSDRASRPARRYTTLNSSTPSALSQVAASHATTPPPSTTTRRGTSRRLVTSRDVHGCASLMPGIAGTVVREPVSITTACRAVSARLPPAAVSTATERSPVSRPYPRTTSMPTPSAQRICEESSRPFTTVSRRASTARTSNSRPLNSEDTPGTCRAPPSTSAGRNRALLGMHAQYEHSPPSNSASTSTASRPENCVAY